MIVLEPAELNFFLAQAVTHTQLHQTNTAQRGCLSLVCCLVCSIQPSHTHALPHYTITMPAVFATSQAELWTGITELGFEDLTKDMGAKATSLNVMPLDRSNRDLTARSVHDSCA